MALPRTLDDLKPHQSKFQDWLLANGSAMLAPTNPYEVLRFIGDVGACVVYRNDAGKLSWTGGAPKAFQSFANGQPWRATDKVKTKADRQKFATYNSLVQRDGDTCMYCGHSVTLEEFSREHVLSVTHGGTNHLANLAITHVACNQQASHLSVREKLELAIKRRACIDPESRALADADMEQAVRMAERNLGIGQ